MDENRKVTEGDIVEPHRDDESRISKRLADSIRDRKLVAHALAVRIDARFRGNIDHLAGVLAKGILDGVPEGHAALEAEHVSPDLVAVASQPGAKPPNEIVVVRCCVADEDRVASHGTVDDSDREILDRPLARSQVSRNRPESGASDARASFTTSGHSDHGDTTLVGP